MIDKPSGTIGSLNSQQGIHGSRLEWESINLPKTKDGIERLMMDRFRKTWEGGGIRFDRVYQNPENHFDFTLKLPEGRVYVDLMELLYKRERGNPYKNPKNLIQVNRYADQIMSHIMKKSEKYSPNEKTPIYLLTYITHFNFQLGDPVIKLLQYRLKDTPTVFEKIFHLSPISRSDSALSDLFPCPQEALTNFDPKDVTNLRYINGDMAGSRRNPDGTVTTVFNLNEFFDDT